MQIFRATFPVKSLNILVVKSIGLCTVYLSCSFLILGTRDLQTKLSIVSLLYEHIQVVTWFLVNGLLPEHAGMGISCFLDLKKECLGRHLMNSGKYPPKKIKKIFKNKIIFRPSYPPFYWLTR
jgi:hypothetical protein